MEPDLNDLINAIPDDEVKDLIAGLLLPDGFTLSRLLFEMTSGYYEAQKALNLQESSSLEFVSNPITEKIEEKEGGVYEVHRSYKINGVIFLGTKGFQPLDNTVGLESE